MPLDPIALIRRRDRLWSLQSNFRNQWQDLADFIQPNKNSVNTQRTPGEKQTQRLFDSTAILANELLAASMHGSLTPSASEWFALKMRAEELNELPEVPEWLDEVETRMYLALNQSNFNQEIDEVYLDLGCFGTGVVFLEEKEGPAGTFNGLRFMSVPPGKYVCDEDAYGRVNVLYRDFAISARSAAARWPNAGEIIRKAAEVTPEKQLQFLHAVEPGQGPMPGMSFRSTYVSLMTKSVVQEGGFYQFPYFAPRWRKSSGEVYGRSPGFTSLPDIKTLNRAKELDLKSWSKYVDPPLQAPDNGVIGSIRMWPGALNITRPNMRIEPLLPPAQHFQTNAIKVEELRQSIRKIFFTDVLEPLGALMGQQKARGMTATEASIRFEIMQRVLGPTLGRLQAELLAPLIDRTFSIMERKKALPPPPPELVEALQQRGLSADQIDVKYQGPLERAQRSGEITAIESWVNFALTVAQAHPEVLDVPEWDGVMRHLGTVEGVPARLINDDRIVKKLRDARAQQMEQMMQEQAIHQAAESAGKAAPMVTALSQLGANGNGTAQAAQ